MQRKRQAIRDHSAEANLFARRATIAFIIVVAMLEPIYGEVPSVAKNEQKGFVDR